MCEHHIECVVPYVRQNAAKNIGCALKIHKVVEVYEDGRADVIMQCTRLVQLERYDKSANSTLPDSADFTEMGRYTQWKANDELLAEWETLVRFWPKKNGSIKSINISQTLHMFQFLKPSYEEKFRFIAMGDPEKQAQIVLNKIKFQRLLLQQEKNIEKGMFLN